VNGRRCRLSLSIPAPDTRRPFRATARPRPEPTLLCARPACAPHTRRTHTRFASSGLTGRRQFRTVLALPEILNEFKSRGYKIVHVVPAAADRPKTASSAQQWVARPTLEQSIANAPTAPRNISPPWAGARAEMSAQKCRAALAQARARLAKHKWVGRLRQKPHPAFLPSDVT
jgi:hypothetical protein